MALLCVDAGDIKRLPPCGNAGSFRKFVRSGAAVHETAGKVALCLIVFRAAWGIVGPASARFREFVRGPKATLAYLLSIAGGKPPHCLGHNPAGAAMIAALLATVAVTCASGNLMTTTAFWGDATVEAVHGVSALLIPWLVAGHLAGVTLATIQHKENNVASMIPCRLGLGAKT